MLQNILIYSYLLVVVATDYVVVKEQVVDLIKTASDNAVLMQTVMTSEGELLYKKLSYFGGNTTEISLDKSSGTQVSSITNPFGDILFIDIDARYNITSN